MAAVRARAMSGTRDLPRIGGLLLRLPMAIALLALVLAGARSALAQSVKQSEADPFKPSVSKASRESALRAIPFDKLDADSRRRVQSVVADVTIFRRMPVRVIQCDPELYQFLMEHPDVVVNIWQVLRLSQISLHQMAPNTYRLSDAAGTEGVVRLVYTSDDTHLMYAEGTYSGPLTAKPVRGQAVLLLKTGYVHEADGRCYITTRLDTFTQVEPGGVELLTKVFQPLLGKIADVNFLQTAAFVGSLSRTAELNSSGVRRLASRLTEVQPEVRDQFAVLAERVAQKAGELPGLEAVGPAEAAVARRPQGTVTQQ